MLLDSLVRGVCGLRSRGRGHRGGRAGASPLRSRVLRCEPLEARQLLSIDLGLDWATYLGGSGNEGAGAIAVDAAGSTLIAGTTLSSDFTGAANSLHGRGDAYVAKVRTDGTLAWAVYLGGSDYLGTMDYDGAFDIAVDGAGNAFVTGSTNTLDFDGANNAFHGGTNDAFVAKVTSDGTLAWATYLGGGDTEQGLDIAIDALGNAIVTGSTSSSDFEGANNSYHGGNYDAFIAKVATDGTLAWATYLGGSDREKANGIAIDGAGNALVTGFSYSADFAGADNSLRGWADAFVAKVTSTGSLEWATFIGGSGTDEGSAIALDAAGNAFLTGGTSSRDFAGANNAIHDPPTHTWKDAFVAKVTASGSLAWATYLGGSWFDGGQGIALDGAGNVLVSGYTNSTDFAGTNNAHHGGDYDAFVAEVTGNGTLAWASYLGGSSQDWGQGIALDGAGNALVSGNTQSSDFEGATNAFHGDRDGFLLKFAPPDWAYATYTVSPRTTVSDNKTITSSLVVPIAYPIVDLNVTVTIAHPSVSDLRLTLIAPDGTQVPLVSAGSISGANLTRTVFDDQAPSPITAGTAPYTGNFRPASPLAALDLKSTNGTWKLQVTDSVKNRKTGVLNSWGLAVLYDTGAGLQSASLTDAALASLAFYDPEFPSKPARGKGLATIPAVDLALAELGV